MNSYKGFFFAMIIIIVGYLSITCLIWSIYSSKLDKLTESTEQEVQALRKAVVYLLSDLYGDCMRERRALSVDVGMSKGGEIRLGYIDSQLQKIMALVEVLDPEMVVGKER